MKNAFYFMLKALFVLEIFAILSRLFGFVEKFLHKIAMVDFRNWTTNNYNKHITQYFIKQRQSGNEI